MYFNVADVLMKSSGYKTLEILDEGLMFDWDGLTQAYVEGTVVIIRTDSGLWVSGDIVVLVQSDCCRCLTEAGQIVNFCLEEEYLPFRDINTGRSIIEPDDYDGFRINDDNILDLSEAIRQYTSVFSPINPSLSVVVALIDTLSSKD